MKLCVVTDIHGLPERDRCFAENLGPKFDLVRFSLAELCGEEALTGNALHYHLFEENGINQAAHALRERLSGDWVGLGYSAGGTALWRAVALGAPLRSLFCISSTRLRNEASISTRSHVFFGADDARRPSADWLTTIPDSAMVLPNAGHDYYLSLQSEAALATKAALIAQLHALASEVEDETGV